MLINELAKKTGLTPHTIRFYEKYGLIKGSRRPDVKTNNYFHYDNIAVDKLELIREAKVIGFSLSEIKQFIDTWFSQQVTADEKIAILDEKLVSIDEKIKQLNEVKNIIAKYKVNIKSNNC